MGAFGKALLNQVGINFLGVDFARLKRARDQEAQRTSFMENLGKRLQGQPARATPAAPVMGADGQDISAAFGPQPDVHEDAIAPLNINSPDMASIALTASRLKVPISTVLETLKAQQPDMHVGPDGSTYNAKSANLPTRFATPTTINGWNVDSGSPGNAGAYFPKLPDGMIPDGKGGVVNVTGLTGAQGAQEEATALGKTRGTMFTVPSRGGAPAMMTGGQYLGGEGAPGAQGRGFGVGPTPADAAYDADLAKASAAQYTGLQTAGQAASGKIATVRQISSLLSGLTTGRYTPAMAEIQSAASSLGIKIDPKWGRVQAADALSNALTLQASGGSLGSGFSNADRDFQKSISPSAMQTPQGRDRIVAFTIAKAQREQEIAQKARQWQQAAGRLDKPDRNGKTFFDYLDAWAEANPLMGRQ